MTLDIQLFERGFFKNIEAVQLTEDNLWDVFEWADSKPFFGPKDHPDDKQHPITGLTVFEPSGRTKANFGDWIYKTPAGDFRTSPDAEFRELFAPAGTADRRAVEWFNQENPIGTPVRYWTGVREGEGQTGVTRTAAHLLGGHTPVVWVTGHPACIALTHVQPMERAA